MNSLEPDDEDSLIDGDALSNDSDEDSPPLPKESLINDSPLNEEEDTDVDEDQQYIPPPPD